MELSDKDFFEDILSNYTLEQYLEEQKPAIETLKSIYGLTTYEAIRIILLWKSSEPVLVHSEDLIKAYRKSNLNSKCY
jgi:hypothetical protein